MNDLHQELQHSLSMKLLDAAAARIETLEVALRSLLEDPTEPQRIKLARAALDKETGK